MPTCGVSNWNGSTVQAVQSRGGVWAFVDYLDNVIRPHACPWPPPELVQKLARSDKQMYFFPEDQPFLVQKLGYYTDLQSVNSEDALVWSYFGPLAYATPDVRCRWAGWLLNHLGCACRIEECAIALWRRVPHPDNYTQGGPELDSVVVTDSAVVMIEAKWRAGESRWQGIDGRTGQIALRSKFIQLLGARIYGDRPIMLLSITLDDRIDPKADDPLCRALFWKDVVRSPVHPLQDEIQHYYDWKGNLIPRRRGVEAPGG